MKCVRPNCENERLARGLCGSHYKKAHHAQIRQTLGDGNISPQMMELRL